MKNEFKIPTIMNLIQNFFYKQLSKPTKKQQNQLKALDLSIN